VSEYFDQADTINSCINAFAPKSEEFLNALIVGSIDPNVKSGSTGDGSASQYVRGSVPLTYSIAFENQPTASAPAAQVVVTDQLDLTKLNPNSVSLGVMRFGSTLVNVPPGLSNYNTTQAINSSLSVRIQGSVNPVSGLLKWTFASIDPSTGLPPTDPTIGFLPPDTDGVKGEAYVTVNISPVSGLATGTQIMNTASVVFDANTPISTQTWLNTIDVDLPTSAASAPSTVYDDNGTANIPVTWTGTDKGSGIVRYSIYVSDNGGTFTQFQSGVSTTSATFVGQIGHTYGFYSIATDGAGNVESGKSSPDVSTIVAVGSSATNLSSSALTGVPGQSITLTATIVAPPGDAAVPTGMVTFTNGNTTLGTGTLNASGIATLTTTTLPLGTDTIIAMYGGDTNFKSSISSSISIVIAPATTMTLLTTSASSANVGSSVTFSATVAATGTTLPPSGQVNFLDGSTVIGTSMLSQTAGSSVATFSTSSLAAGNHSITANYLGVAGFVASTSPALAETIIPPGLMLSVSPPSITIVHGQSGVATISITPLGGFSNQVALACSGLPAYSTCSFSPSSVLSSGSAAASSVLTIATDVANASLAPRQGPNRSLPTQRSSGEIAIALTVGLLFVGDKKRFHERLRGKYLGRSLLFVFVLCLGLMSLSGCGGSSPRDTPVGTSTVTVTATSGSISQSLSLTVVIQ
jgi:hypothetical protein